MLLLILLLYYLFTTQGYILTHSESRKSMLTKYKTGGRHLYIKILGRHYFSHLLQMGGQVLF